MKNKNILLFSVTMLILLLGISIVSAADTNNSLPTSTQITKDINTIETPTITQSDNKVDSNKVTDNKDTNIQKSSKTIKNTEIQDITKKVMYKQVQKH